MREIRKWLKQAEEDLKAAEDSLKDEHYIGLAFKLSNQQRKR